jgi:hypothetical protein
MRTSTLLRIAALLALVQAVAHAAMFLTAQPTNGPDEIAVVGAMKAHAFLFGGFSRTYWDLYFGYGLLAALVVVFEAALLWLLAGLARDEPARLRGVIALLIAYNLAHAALLLRYFFLVPIVADGVVTLVLVLALLSARSRRAA